MSVDIKLATDRYYYGGHICVSAHAQSTNQTSISHKDRSPVHNSLGSICLHTHSRSTHTVTQMPAHT